MPNPPAVPSGLNEIIAMFADLRPYIQDDGTLSAKWEIDEMTRSALPFRFLFRAIRAPLLRRSVPSYAVGCLHSDISGGFRARSRAMGAAIAGRAKRISAQRSAHAWSIAVDLNVETNQPGAPRTTWIPGLSRHFDDRLQTGRRFLRLERPSDAFQYCTDY